MNLGYAHDPLLAAVPKGRSLSDANVERRPFGTAAKKRACKPRGFTINELLFCLILLGIFAAAAQKLFFNCMLTLQHQQDQANQTSAFDSAVRQLRSDVSQPTALPIVQKDNLLLLGNSGVAWRRDDDHDLSRIAGSESHQWNIGQNIHFKIDGSLLLLQSNAKDDPAAIAMALGGAK